MVKQNDKLLKNKGYPSRTPDSDRISFPGFGLDRENFKLVLYYANFSCQWNQGVFVDLLNNNLQIFDTQSRFKEIALIGVYCLYKAIPLLTFLYKAKRTMNE